MRVLICGGRDFNDEEFVFSTMDRLDGQHDITVVIHGDARGADTLGKRWAKSAGKQVVSCPADWNKHGKAAGAIRNQQMLTAEKPDLVVAFPGGTGTDHMISISRKAGVTVVQPKKDTMSQRKTFIRLLPVAAVAATTGVDSEAFDQLKHILGANQNDDNPENDKSFSTVQWTAARDALRAIESLRREVSLVRSVKS